MSSWSLKHSVLEGWCQEVTVKGKKTFSAEAAEQILRLLRDKVKSDSDSQKPLRNTLRRKYGFYITDFPGTPRPFKQKAFNDLVAKGRINIVG